MGFYHATENPCVKMRVNHKTKSCECIIIHQDEFYTTSSTIQEILHILKEKIEINPHVYQGLILIFLLATHLNLKRLKKRD